jgi:hypothetical protein
LSSAKSGIDGEAGPDFVSLNPGYACFVSRMRCSAKLRHSASKTRVNALLVPHCARETNAARYALSTWVRHGGPTG